MGCHQSQISNLPASKRQIKKQVILAYKRTFKQSNSLTTHKSLHQQMVLQDTRSCLNQQKMYQRPLDLDEQALLIQGSHVKTPARQNILEQKKQENVQNKENQAQHLSNTNNIDSIDRVQCIKQIKDSNLHYSNQLQLQYKSKHKMLAYSCRFDEQLVNDDIPHLKSNTLASMNNINLTEVNQKPLVSKSIIDHTEQHIIKKQKQKQNKSEIVVNKIYKTKKRREDPIRKQLKRVYDL